jgi:alkaline phosphatase D
MTEVFVHAVASFEPTDTSVLLWTRLTGATTATWTIARDAELADVVATGHATTDASRDCTVVEDVTGLQPGTTYWYRFEADGQRSPLGRTRTLPAGPTERFVLGLVSCAHYPVAPLGVYRAIAERDVDLVLHLGDYMYEDGTTKGPRTHRPPHAAVTLEDYRQRLAQLREDTDLQALHLRHPVVTIWDDHDLADNAWRTGAKPHDPERHGPWEARVAAAAQARQEWVPGRLQDPLVTWRAIRIGDLIDLLLLDTRFAGRDQHAGDPGTKDLRDPDRSLLGDQQRSWVQASLADQRARWALVASGVVINPICLHLPVGKRVNALLPNGYATIDDEVLHDDQWDGYPAERDRLVKAVRARADAGGRTILLSGDVHSSWAFEGPVDPASGTPVAVEVTTPAVSSAPMGRAHYPGLWRLVDRAANRLDHVRWVDLTERGFVLLEVGRDAVRAEWWFVHPYDEDPGGSAELAAAFTTDRAAWPPRLERIPVRGARSRLLRRRPPASAHVDPIDGPPLPSRPDDLGAMRRWRRRRLARDAAAVLAPVTAIPGAVAVGRRRRRPGLRSRR